MADRRRVRRIRAALRGPAHLHPPGDRHRKRVGCQEDQTTRKEETRSRGRSPQAKVLRPRHGRLAHGGDRKRHGKQQLPAQRAGRDPIGALHRPVIRTAARATPTTADGRQPQPIHDQPATQHQRPEAAQRIGAPNINRLGDRGPGNPTLGNQRR